MAGEDSAAIRMRSVAELSGGRVTRVLDAQLKALVVRSGKRFLALNPWFQFRKASFLRHFEHATDVNIPTPLFVGVAHEGLLTQALPAAVVVKRDWGHSCKGVWVFANRLEGHDVLHNRSWSSVLQELILEQSTIVIERKLASNVPDDPRKPVPFDFKAYARGPDAEVVQLDVVDRNAPCARISVYDPQAKCFLGPDVYDPPITNPWSLADLAAVYPEILEAVAAGTAFARNHLRLEDGVIIRIDMYVVEGKVWLGELTPTPGNFNGHGPDTVADYLSLKHFPNIRRR